MAFLIDRRAEWPSPFQLGAKAFQFGAHGRASCG